MTHVIVRTTVGPSSEVCLAAEALGVATLHEALNRRGLLQPYMRGIYQGPAIAGRAVTVLCQPGDNLMLHAAVEQCQAGDVLVVTTTSVSTDGMFGELLATSLRARGVKGLVIEAGVRDVAELTAMRFPVWSRAVSAQGTVKASPGSVNVTIPIAGAVVNPGDLIVCDDDGVVVVPLKEAADACDRGHHRVSLEAKKREKLAAGVLGLDLYGLRQQLTDLGVTYVDGPVNDAVPVDAAAQS